MMLKIQWAASGGRTLEDEAGGIKRRALGYVYGFIDAALRTLGHDMGDESVGMPITYEILARLFGGKAQGYMSFLIAHVSHDSVLREGVMTGGRQYLEFNRPDATGSAMGFARYLISGDAGVGE